MKLRHRILRGLLSAGLVCSLLPLARAQFSQQDGKLVGTGAAGAANQGTSVALSADGNTAIVGGILDNGLAGAAWVFVRSGGVWGQQGGKLVGTGAVGGAQQGWSVALSADGNTAIVGGANDNNNVGAAWVFTRTSGQWTQQGNKLVGTSAVGAAWQGRTVALSGDGNTAMVGGTGDNNNAGAVWVFTRTGGVWSQQGSKLVGTGAAAGSNPGQGSSVALSSDGNTAMVGGEADNKGAGAVWVFTRTGGVWNQQGSKLVGTGAAGAANQGSSVALSSDGNSAIAGGFGDDGYTGAAWVFTRTGGQWSQQGIKLVGTGAVGAAQQGWSIALSGDGNTAIVGGRFDNGSAGAAWVFTRTGGAWSQLGSKLVGTGAAGSALQGLSVALSGDGHTAVVGGASDNNQAGAAWVFVGTTPVTVATNPPGLSIIVDSLLLTAPQTFSWAAGSQHTIGVLSPQTTTGTRNTFTTWSDGINSAHTITVLSAATTYTANFTTQYLLTTQASPAAGGTVTANPNSIFSDGYYDSGASVQLTANANPGYQFGSWSGDLTGTASPQSVTMSAPRNVTANFSALPSKFLLSLQASPAAGGSISANPASSDGYYAAGTVVQLTAAAANCEYQFANWSGDMTGPANPQTVTMSAPRTVTANFTKYRSITDNACFVCQLYLDLLGRTPDDAGLNYWAGRLANGTMTRSQLADSFFNSAEFQGNGMFIISAYVAVLGRNPDYDGWLWWLTNLWAGVPKQALIDVFIQSTEFQQTYGTLDNTAFITLVYQNVLGRPPDLAGLTFWVGQLSAGAATRAEIMYSFAVSPEFQNRIQNQALATLLYMGFLRRSPDPTGVAYWTSQLNYGIPAADVLNSFITSAEYMGRF